MKTYSARDMQVKGKEMFEQADLGEEIVIKRKGKIYLLKVPFNQEVYKEVGNKISA